MHRCELRVVERSVAGAMAAGNVGESLHDDLADFGAASVGPAPSAPAAVDSQHSAGLIRAVFIRRLRRLHRPALPDEPYDAAPTLFNVSNTITKGGVRPLAPCS